MNALKTFFVWIAYQPGYKSRIHVPDVEFLNLSEKDVSIAKAVKHKTAPTLEQVRRAILAMPSSTEIERRDRAVIAFSILTGMRDRALASLRIKHVDLSCDPILVRQEPDLVKTKFSKQIFTYFFPIGDDAIKAIAVDWIRELREVKLYGEDAPIFPRTAVTQDENQCFARAGLEPVCWSTATPIRRIFKDAFQGVGLPYFHPHLFRHTLAKLGQEICKTPEQFKAWSQCFGHATPHTTFASYGNLDPYRQGEVMKNLSSQHDQADKMDLILNAIKGLQK
jgi:integrase